MRMIEVVMMREGGRREGGQPIAQATSPSHWLSPFETCAVIKFTADRFFTVYTVSAFSGLYSAIVAICAINVRHKSHTFQLNGFHFYVGAKCDCSFSKLICNTSNF